MTMQTLAQALATTGRRTRQTPQFTGFITDLIVPNEDSVKGANTARPQAFLVEQTPDWTLPTHFHAQHQFQVFVAGSGSLGKHAVEQLGIHYASPYSAYGPLLSGAQGVSYLTLRLIGDTGAWYLPEARPHLPLRIKKQQVHAAPGATALTPALTTLDTALEEILITPEESGLAAWLIRLPPHQKIPAPACGAHNGGRFYVVTQGALLVDGMALTGLATLFVARDQVQDVEAGAAGLELLILQFPEAALVGEKAALKDAVQVSNE
ncbi:hypothetical protein ACVBEF_14510 [Glaciimonas sp. GG7]